MSTRTWDEVDISPDGVVARAGKPEFGDKRLNERFVASMKFQVEAPDHSYPEIFGEGQYLEGYYRWARNEKVTMQRAIKPQFTRTVQRCEDLAEFYVIHDTTDFVFGGETRREGMGRVNAKDQGFLAHVSLALKADGTREPVGLLDTQVWTRRPEEGPDPYDVEPMWTDFEENEADKWGLGVDHVKGRLDEEQSRAIHVMDSGADNYDLWADLVESDCRFAIRCCQTQRRLVATKDHAAPTIADAVERAEPVSDRTVWLNPRGQKGRPTSQLQKHPPREARHADLEIRTNTVEIKRPARGDQQLPETLELHLVVALESGPPEGEEPVEWILVTTEAVDSASQAESIVEAYQARWTIEELNKAIKTGCSYEDRQLESSHALLNAFAMTVPIAVELLRVRTLCHYAPELRAGRVLSDVQQHILADNRRTSYEIGSSVEEALVAIAQLGGFLTHNEKPGWLTMMRGMKRLHTLESGYQLAAQHTTSNE